MGGLHTHSKPTSGGVRKVYLKFPYEGVCRNSKTKVNYWEYWIDKNKTAEIVIFYTLVYIIIILTTITIIIVINAKFIIFNIK